MSTNFFNNKHENKEIISKGITIGITHVDTPVVFQLKTTIQPMSVQAMGASPIIHSVIKDTPYLSFTLQVDRDKEFLLREIMKSVKATGGLLPIRSYDLTQFIYPVEENPGIYAGVGSKLIPLVQNDDYTRVATKTTRIDIDQFYKKFADGSYDIEAYADFFYKTYIPWYNVAYCQIYNTEGNAPVLEMFIQPVDMFAYFPDGLSIFLKDDNGVVLQEAIQRYSKIHQGNMLHPDLQKFFGLFSNAHSETTTSTGIEPNNYGTILYTKNNSANDLYISGYNPSVIGYGEKKDNLTINLFATDSKKTISYNQKTFTATLYNDNEPGTRTLKYKDIQPINIRSLYDKSIDTKDYTILIPGLSYDSATEALPDGKYIIVEDGDTLETFQKQGDEQEAPRSFRLLGIDSFETMKRASYSGINNADNTDYTRFQMQINRVRSFLNPGETDPITGSTISSTSLVLDSGKNMCRDNIALLFDYRNGTQDPFNSDRPDDETIKLINSNFMLAYYFVAEIATAYTFNILTENKSTPDKMTNIVDYSEYIQTHNRSLMTIPELQKHSYNGISLSTSYLKDDLEFKDFVLKDNTTATTLAIKLFAYKFVSCLRNKDIGVKDIEIDILTKYLTDVSKDTQFFIKIQAFLHTLNSANKNVSYNEKTTQSNFTHVLDENNSSTFFDIYNIENEKDIYLLSPNYPISLHKTIISEKIGDKIREYDVGANLYLYDNTNIGAKKQFNDIFGVYNPEINLIKNNTDLPNGISTQYIRDRKCYLFSTTMMYNNSRNTQHLNYIFSSIFSSKDNINVGDNDTDTLSLTHSPQQIDGIISSIQNYHITLYPELSEPFRKLINSFDEDYIENKYIYKYTYTKNSNAYPLLYTNNNIFTSPKNMEHNDVVITYNSQNKINTDIIESMKYALNYVFFETESNFKSLLDEFDLSPTEKESWRIFYDPYYGGKTMFKHTAKLNDAYVYRTYGNTLSDYLTTTYGDSASTNYLLVNMGSGDLLSFLKKAFNDAGGTHESSIPSILTTIGDQISKTGDFKKLGNKVISWKENKVDFGDIPTYKQIYDRMFLIVKYTLTTTKEFIKKCVENGRVNAIDRANEFIYDLDGALSSLESLKKSYDATIATGKIINVETFDGKKIDLSQCEKETASELVSLSVEVNNFMDVYKKLVDIVRPLTLAKPLIHLAKKLIINNNSDTSITAINYIYESNNIPVTKSSTSVGSYFQHVGSSKEKIVISIRSSSFQLMRQLVLLYYTNDFTSKNILDLEKSRTSYAEYSTTPIYETLKNRSEDIFKRITKSDLESVNFDYSLKIDNDFLNSYGIRFGYIEDITVNAVENKVGLYNINVVLVKTSPKEIVGNNIKAFNKAPFRNVVTEHFISKGLELELPDSRSQPSIYETDLYKYVEIISSSAGISFAALSSIAVLLHKIYENDQYKVLRRYLKLDRLAKYKIQTTIYDSSKEEFSTKYKEGEVLPQKIDENSSLDAALALITSLFMGNHSSFVEVFSIITSMLEELKFPNTNPTIEKRSNTGVYDVAKNQLGSAIDESLYDTYQYVYKNLIIGEDGSTFGSSSDRSIENKFIEIIYQTATEMLTFFTTGNDEYFSYLHYLALALKFGGEYIKFEYNFPVEKFNSAEKDPGDSIYSILRKSGFTEGKSNDFQNTMYEIKNILKQARALYSYDETKTRTSAAQENKMYTSQSTIDTLKELDAIVNSLPTKKDSKTPYTNFTGSVKSDTIKDESYISSENTEPKIGLNKDKIVFYIRYSPTFIRILHTFQSMLRSHGYNSYREIDELDLRTIDNDNDFYDSPLTKQLSEFYLTNSFEEFYSNIKLNLTLSTEFEEDEARNKEVKKKINYELKYNHLLLSKIVPYNITDVDISKNRTPIINSYDLLSMKNIINTHEVGFGNEIINFDFSKAFVAYKVLTESFDPMQQKNNNIFEKVCPAYALKRATTWVKKLSDITKYLQTDGSVFFEKLVHKKSDLENARFFVSLYDFMNVSAFGTTTNIVSSVTEEVYKMHLTPTIFSGKEPILSYLVSDDMYYWCSSSLMFGSAGGNNPYANGFFSEGNYAQTSLPTVYCLPKKTIVQYLKNKDIYDFSIHYILKSMLMGSKCNTSPAFYIYDQQTMSTVFNYMSSQLQDMAELIGQQLAPVKPRTVNDVVNDWLQANKSNVLRAAKNIRTLKSYITNLTQIERFNVDAILSGIDAAVETIMSINMYVYSETFGIKSEDIRDPKKKAYVKNRESEMGENQKKIDLAATSLQTSVVHVFNYFNKTEQTEIAKNISQLMADMFDSIQTARKSVQLMDEFEMAGGVELFKGKYQETMEYLNNEDNGLSETMRSVINMIQSTSYSNITSPVHNSAMYTSILKDSSSNTAEKQVNLSIAYPIVKILFTKEDIPDMLVFDEMFIYSNIVSATVHSAIKTCSTIATIEIADPFDDLHNVLGRRLTRRRSNLDPFEVSPSSAEGLSSFTLEVGSSIQIRMGYSRYLGDDSIVFNGRVASINENPQSGTKLLTAYNFGSNLLTPYSPKSLNIANDDSWYAYSNNKNSIDEHDYTISFGYLQDIYFNKPEAFSGLSTPQTFGSLNRMSYADQYIKSQTSQRTGLVNQVAVSGSWSSNVLKSQKNVKRLLFYGGIISNDGIGVLQNYKPIRPSTSTSILLPTDYCYEANKSVWNMMKQMQLHYINHYLLVRPFDNHESIVFTHMDSTYKFSSSMVGSNYNFEALAEQFNPLNKKDKDIVEKYTSMFKKVFPAITFIKPSELTIENCKEKVSLTYSTYSPTDKSKIDAFITQLILASTYCQYMKKEKELEFNIYNSNYDDIKSFLKTEAGLNKAVDALSFYYISLNEYNKNLKYLEDFKARQLIADISTVVITAGAAATGYALVGGGISSLVSSGLNAWGKSAENSIFLTNKFLRTIYDSIIILSKNYRKVSQIHTIYSNNIIFNNFQLLENANTISMSYFNASDAIGGIATQISKGAGAAGKALFGPSGEKAGQSAIRFISSAILHIDQRNVREMADTSKWINVEFPFHSYLPADKRRSTVTLQPNAVFIQQFGVDEPKVVATNIMRHVMNEYYGGNVLLMGSPSIFVADRVYIDDNRTNMSGVFECREVTHIFNAQMGFVTSITPSLYARSDETILDGKRDGGLATSQIVTQIAFPLALTTFSLNAMFRYGGRGLRAIKSKNPLDKVSDQNLARAIRKSPIGRMVSNFRSNMFRPKESLAPGAETVTKSFSSTAFNGASKFVGKLGSVIGMTMLWSWMRNLAASTVAYPLITTFSNSEIRQNIYCVEKKGEPLISNLDGLDKAELLKLKGNKAQFRINETIRNIQDISSDEFDTYQSLINGDNK